MDRSIRDKSRRRRFLLASVTAAGAFVVVYFANAAYHELLLDKLGLSQALVDALGAAAAVLVICAGSFVAILPNDSFYWLVRRDALERAPEWRSVSVLAGGALLQALMALAMVWLVVGSGD